MGDCVIDVVPETSVAKNTRRSPTWKILSMKFEGLFSQFVMTVHAAVRLGASEKWLHTQRA